MVMGIGRGGKGGGGVFMCIYMNQHTRETYLEDEAGRLDAPLEEGGVHLVHRHVVPPEDLTRRPVWGFGSFVCCYGFVSVVVVGRVCIHGQVGQSAHPAA